MDVALARLDAAHRALSMVGQGMYILSAGGYDPHAPMDRPFGPGQWQDASGLVHTGIGADCSAFALWCHHIAKHRPGFNRGEWSTTADDLNTDSIVEDALHRKDLFELADAAPAPGDLVVYRGIWEAPTGAINDDGIGRRRWIGHVGVIVGVPADYQDGQISRLGVVHCHGPNGCTPAVAHGDGFIWAHHQEQWYDGGKWPLRRAFVVRVKTPATPAPLA